jgi:hypothetical protein
MAITRSEIIGEIRRQRIRGPHQRGFNLDAWSRSLMGATDDNPENKPLRTSGVIFHELMSNLRVEAENLLREYIDPRTAIFHLVARANVSAADLRARMLAGQDGPERESFDSSDIVARRIELGDGRRDSADQLMMGLIDSVVYPIQKYLNAKLSSGPNSADTKLEWDNILLNANQYCLAYNFCQKAIYQRKYLNRRDGVWTLEAIDSAEARLLSVSDFFGEESSAERALSLELAGPQSLPTKIKAAALPRRRVDRLTTNGKYYAVKTLNRRLSGNTRIPPSMIMAMATTSPGTVSLLAHQIDGIAPGTLPSDLSDDLGPRYGHLQQAGSYIWTTQNAIN